MGDGIPTRSMPWPAKVAIAAGVTGWMSAVYYGSRRLELGPATVVPATAVDRWVTFRPAAAWVYLSVFPLLLIVPLRLTGVGPVLRYAGGLAALGTVAAVLFAIWPTVVPRPAGPMPADPAYRFVRATDDPTNACPSVHAGMVAFAVLAAARGWPAGPGRWLVAAWAGVVLYATIATRQHVLLDLVAGAALGGFAFAISHWEARA